MSKFIDSVFDKTFHGLQKNLELTYRRNEAITSNIANAETPGYRAVDLNFAQELEKSFGAKREVLQKNNAGHMDVARGSGNAHLAGDYSGATKDDGNNVDLDIQMGKMSRNGWDYMESAAMIRKKLQIIRDAIRLAER